MQQKLRRLLFVFIGLLMLMPSNTYAHQTKKNSNVHSPLRPKVAIVMSGGGAKGFAHIGALKVIEELGIPVDIVVGTSIGSIVGGLYSIGYSPSAIETFCREQNWTHLLSDNVPRRYLSKHQQLLKQRFLVSIPVGKKFQLLPQGVIRGQNIINLFCGLFGNVPEESDFTKLPKSFACVATDLETGEKVVIKDGFLPTALYASMAIPGAFEPCFRNGQMLIDGGLADNFPVDIAKEMGADIIIGLDIRSGLKPQKSINNIVDIVDQLVSLYDPVENNRDEKFCNVIIRPDMTGFSATSFTQEAIDTLTQRGELAAREQIDKLKAIINQYQLDTTIHQIESPYVAPQKWYITDIEFCGHYRRSENILKKEMELLLPKEYSYEEIKTAIDKIYGAESFDKIFFSVEPNGQNGNTLRLHMREEKSATTNLGLRVNTTDAAAILLNYTQRDYTKALSLFSATANLSANPSVTLLGEFQHKNSPTLGVQLEGNLQHIYLLTKTDAETYDKIYSASLKLYLTHRFFRIFDAELGFHSKYYYGDIYQRLVSPDSKPHSLPIDAYIQLSLNTFDDYYFPTKGSSFILNVSAQKELLEKSGIAPAVLLSNKNVIPIAEKWAFLIDVHARYLFNNKQSIFEYTLCGGSDYSIYYPHQLSFYGINNPTIIPEKYTHILTLGTRFNFYKKHYISLRLSGMYYTDNFTTTWNNFTTGGAISYGLNTFIGPLEATIGYGFLHNAPTFQANLGYWF